MYRYLNSSFEENSEFVKSYVRSLSGKIDEFLEDHILMSEFYSVFVDKKHCGYFAILDKAMLTQFYINKPYIRHAQVIFSEVLDKFKIKNAFVPTCDELLLSLCLDRHSSVKLQAYFFEESGGVVRPAEYNRELMTVACMEDLEEIREITGDFIDRHEERIQKKQLYVMRDKGEFLGLGIIVDNMLLKGYACTGMFTNEKYRNMGIGRSIILHLMSICREREVKSLAGCWYYNHNSKKTLESAGYITKTRLLNIEF